MDIGKWIIDWNGHYQDPVKVLLKISIDSPYSFDCSQALEITKFSNAQSNELLLLN